MLPGNRPRTAEREMAAVLLGNALDCRRGAQRLHVRAGFVPPYGDRGLAADIAARPAAWIPFCGNRSRIPESSSMNVDVRIPSTAAACQGVHESSKWNPDLSDNAIARGFHPRACGSIVNWTSSLVR